MQYDKSFYQIRSNEHIMQKLQDEMETVGYYKLPFADVDHILDFASGVTQRYIVILGIGGSSLGSNAIYEFLRYKENFDKELIFLESTDPVNIKAKLSSIYMDDAMFVFISKSGNTVETIAILKYISTLVELSEANTVVISGKNTYFSNFAHQYNVNFFELDDNIGGRFSVFSVVGLLPLSLLGVDIKNMLNSAKKVYHSFFSGEVFYDMLMEKARFIVENKGKFNINILFSYSSALEHFNKWYIQLWAESLGKININGTKQGLTPIGLLGPVDQHSFLQLIMEGVRDKTVTFIKIANFEEKIIIPSNSMFTEFSDLDGLSFSKLIDLQANATIESIKELEDVPYDVITIDKIDEYNIAELMYSYELLVSIIGAFLQINTYDQPGVESGKLILKEKLKRVKSD